MLCAVFVCVKKRQILEEREREDERGENGVMSIYEQRKGTLKWERWTYRACGWEEERRKEGKKG